MLMKKVMTGTAALLLLGLTAAGVGVAALPGSSERPGESRPVALAPPPAEDGDSPPAEVERGRPPSYRTANFLVTAPSMKVARQVGRALERHRKALAVRWLGKELPNWPEPCPVRVKLGPGSAGHATSFEFHPDGRVTRREMLLQGRLDRVLADLAPHEVMHTILADWSRRPVPRWADEGAAQMAESAPSQARYEAALAKVLKEGRRLPLRQLLPQEDYGRDVPALYAQGYSLTAFLVRSGGRAKFLAFVAQGQRDGWDEAARDQYGYANVEALERDWLARVRPADRAEAQPHLPPPTKAAATPIRLRLLGVTAEGPRVTISWTATGDLGPRPMALFYAARKEGPWHPAAAELPNTGRCWMKLPADAPAWLWVRVQATDRAGHAAAVQTTEPVRVEARPRGWPRGKLPTGPAPVQALVKLDRQGRLRVWQHVTVYEPPPAADAGRQQVTTYRAISTVMATVHALEEIRVFDTAGKAVDPKELPRLLKGETPALISADGRPVDPLHLRLTRTGTLLFVLPPTRSPQPAPVYRGQSPIEPAPPSR
jgi:hypothetical protein